LAASRHGDFGELLALLDPDVVMRADDAAVRAGASAEVVGARAVAKTLSGRAREARLAMLGGVVGAMWASDDGRPRVAFDFTIVNGRITEISLHAEPAELQGLEWTELSE